MSNYDGYERAEARDMADDRHEVELEALRLENTALRQSIEAVAANRDARARQRDEALQLAEQYRKVAVAAARLMDVLPLGNGYAVERGVNALKLAMSAARSAGLLTDEEIKE